MEQFVTTIKNSIAIEDVQFMEMQKIEQPPVRREKSNMKRKIYVWVRLAFTVIFLLMLISIVKHGIVASILMVISILFMCPVTAEKLMPQIKRKYLIASSVFFMYAACMAALLLQVHIVNREFV